MDARLRSPDRPLDPGADVTDPHVHAWRDLTVGFSPWSAEEQGPLAAELLDDPTSFGETVRTCVERGDLVLSAAEAEEQTEEHEVRYCTDCGRVEEREDGVWVYVSTIDFSRRRLTS